MAGGRGFEPRLTESESVVLPLDDPPLIQLRVLSYEWRGEMPVNRSFRWLVVFYQALEHFGQLGYFFQETLADFFLDESGLYSNMQLCP